MEDTDNKPTVAILGSGSGALRLLAGLHGRLAEPAPIKDAVTAPPVVSGPHGQAWLCDMDEIARRYGFKRENDGTLANWIVEAPWAHPAWHSYAVVLVHLRPLPGRLETLFYLDGATHEMWVYALDPNTDRNKVLIGKGPNSWLQPVNFSAQFIEISDQLALDRVRAAVQEICNGTLSPDTDFIREWTRRFGDNMLLDRARPQPPRRR